MNNNNILYKALDDALTKEFSSNLLDNDMMPEHIFSDSFNTQINQILNMSDNPPEKQYIYFFPGWKKAIQIFCLVLISCLMLTFSVFGVSRILNEFSIINNDDYCLIQSDSSNLNARKSPKINKNYFINYDLSDYNMETLIDNDWQREFMFVKDNNYVKITQTSQYNNYINSQWENDEYIKINGNDAILIISENFNCIIWKSNNDIFEVMGNLNKKTLIEIAKSIQIAE